MKTYRIGRLAIDIGAVLKLPNMNLQNLRRRLAYFIVRGWLKTEKPNTLLHGTVPHKGLYRVLICRPNHRLGNLLLLTPLLAELQDKYPGTQVDLIVGGTQASNLFRGFSNVGKVYSLPRHALRHPLNFLHVVHQLRQQRYDLAIDPDISSQSGRFLASLCNATYSIGFSGKKASGKLTCTIPVPPSTRHMGQLPVLLFRWALARNEFTQSASTFPTLDLQLSPAERTWGKCKLNAILQTEHDRSELPTIALYTHATAAKRYGSKWWMRMLAALRLKYPYARFLEILPEHGESEFSESVPGYYSSNPRRVAAIIAATRMILVADGGIMHLACACRGPSVVGLFSCTDPNIYGPYGLESRAILTNGLEPTEICRMLGSNFGIDAPLVTSALEQ